MYRALPRLRKSIPVESKNVEAQLRKYKFPNDTTNSLEEEIYVREG